MIENYLKTGIRVKWTKPRDGIFSATGDVVPSTQAANTMKYDGLDGELQNPQFMVTHVSALGLAMGQAILHDWLDYLPGGTATKLLSGQDILTGWMSGCPIAKWTSPTGTYVGHVGTINGNPTANKRVKKKFLPNLVSSTTAFDPLKDWPNNEITPLMDKFKAPPENHVLGLVTNAGEFHSILIFGIKATVGATTDWCIGGIKRARTLSNSELLRKLS